MASYVGKVTGTDGNVCPVGSTLIGTCATISDTADKVVSCANFDKLLEGVTIRVLFSYAQYGAATLNVNSTGAKTIIAHTIDINAGINTTGVKWGANQVVTFTLTTIGGTQYWYMNETEAILVRTYTDIIGTTNNHDGACFYFGKLRPNVFNEPTRIHYRVYVYVPSDANYASAADVFVQFQAGQSAYNESVTVRNTSYKPVQYQYWGRLTAAGFNDANNYGNILGCSLHDGTKPTDTNYKRTFIIEILEVVGGVFTFFDTMTLYPNIPGTGSTNYSVTNGVFHSNGTYPDGNNYERLYVQERLKAGTNGAKQYSLMAVNSNRQYESFVTSSGTSTTKAYYTAGKFLFKPKIYYYAKNGNTASGSVVDSAAVYDAMTNIDMRYSAPGITTSAGFTSWIPVFLEITFDSNGFWSVTSTGFTQTLTAGKYYIWIGVAISVYQVSLGPNHPTYYYDGTNLIDADKQLRSTTYSAGNHLQLTGTTFRVADYCKTIMDWNDAKTNGWYMASGAANAPYGSTWWFGSVIAHNEKYCIQEVWQFTFGTDTTTNITCVPHYRRIYRNEVWGTWQDANATSMAFIYDDAENATTNCWHKVCDVSIKNTYYDAWITFLVNRTYRYSSSCEAGVLQAHIRTGSTKTFSSGELKWLVSGKSVDVNNFVLVYTDTANTSCTAELWVKASQRYIGYAFSVLQESSRIRPTKDWQLFNTDTTGQDALPTGTTGQITSTLIDCLTIRGTTSGTISYGSTSPKIRFMNNSGTQNGELIWTDYDSYQAPASLTLISDQAGAYFVTPRLRLDSSATTDALLDIKDNNNKVFNFRYSSSTKSNSCIITCYPYDANGSGVVFNRTGGGFCLIGAGESVEAFRAAVVSTDKNPYGTSAWSYGQENMCLTSDTHMYFVTGANGLSSTAFTDWTNLKTVILDNSGNFKPSVNNKGSIGASGYQWNTAYINTIYENGTSLVDKYAAKSHTHNYAGSSSAGGVANSAYKLIPATVRPVSADTSYQDGCMRTFLASTTMTTGDPGPDGNIIDLQWDNNGGYAKQIFVSHTGNGGGDTATRMKLRSQAGTVWKEWIPVAVFNETTPTTGRIVVTDGTDGGVKSASFDIDTSVTENSSNLVTSGAVWTAIDDLPEPMVFRGSLGTGGTITVLPEDGTAKIGDTYKVITTGTYASQAAKIGDTFICDSKTSSTNTWVLIPSGDEPSGTVTSVATGAGLTGGTITTSGTIKAKLQSETPLGADAMSVSSPGTITSSIYPVLTDQTNGNLATYVPCLPLSGGTMTGQLKTSFKSSVAVGSYQATSTTIPDLCEELRYSSGCMGSASIGTAYTKDGITIAATWYNFLWIPHRSGGVNGQASGDNCSYGTLILSVMTGGSGAYLIRYSSAAIAELRNLYKDTLNTAGSTDTSSKIFLIGATSQAANPQTYSDNEVYATSGALTTKTVSVGGGSCTMQYNTTTQSLDFVFA